MKSIAFIGATVLAMGAVACSHSGERRASNDAAVATEVRQELADAKVPGAIDVAFVEGTATLTGTVPDAAAKTRAQEIADGVKGVDRVVNNLRTTTAADAPMRPGMQPGTLSQPGAPAAPYDAPNPGAAPNEPAPAMR